MGLDGGFDLIAPGFVAGVVYRRTDSRAGELMGQGQVAGAMGAGGKGEYTDKSYVFPHPEEGKARHEGC